MFANLKQTSYGFVRLLRRFWMIFLIMKLKNFSKKLKILTHLVRQQKNPKFQKTSKSSNVKMLKKCSKKSKLFQTSKVFTTLPPDLDFYSRRRLYTFRFTCFYKLAPSKLCCPWRNVKWTTFVCGRVNLSIATFNWKFKAQKGVELLRK